MISLCGFRDRSARIPTLSFASMISGVTKDESLTYDGAGVGLAVMLTIIEFVSLGAVAKRIALAELACNQEW